jgi:hypothetical protein
MLTRTLSLLLFGSGPLWSGPGPANGTPIRHFLSAVHQALDSPPAQRRNDWRERFGVLQQRADIVSASIDRLLANPDSGEGDYFSEGDHILHQVADLPPVP